uniref:Uncharacterized protein n=1 Tax=Timema cristinae TaxID=61476 RepID=A0A7R9CYS2_TIMCR|nr:unnamed protein product [Timema cristinae]
MVDSLVARRSGPYSKLGGHRQQVKESVDELRKKKARLEKSMNLMLDGADNMAFLAENSKCTVPYQNLGEKCGGKRFRPSTEQSTVFRFMSQPLFLCPYVSSFVNIKRGGIR